MVCGGRLNCTARDSIAQANPDISGYGFHVHILTAFILSAAMAITAVLYAYLSDSMPEIYLSVTDQEFIADFQLFVARVRNSRLFRPLLLLSRWRRDTDHPRSLSRKQREKAITQFIVSLSDQQLVTGLSILIAAITNQCLLSPTEFRIAFSLAWFSATTHLATLDCLWHYFIFHKTIRNWRVFGMLLIMVLFLYCFVIVLMIDNNLDEEPVQCYIDGLVESGVLTDALDLAMSYVPWAITVFILLFGYKTRIFRTYEYGSSDVVGLGPLSRWVLTVWSRQRYRKGHRLPEMSAQEWKYVRNEAALEVSATTRRRLVETVINTKHARSQSNPMLRLKKLIGVWNLAEYRYQHSLLPLVPPMTFMLSYGLAQMVWFRWQLSGPTDIDLNPIMGFGQITAVILLALPFFSAAEIYYESIHHPDRVTPQNNNRDYTTQLEITSTDAEMKHGRSTSNISPDLGYSQYVDLETKALAFERHLHLVQRYFYTECKELSHLQLNPTNIHRTTTLLALKRHLLDATDPLVKQETELKSVIASLIKIFMLLSASLSAAAAVLFNTPSVIGQLLAAIYLYLQLVFQIGGWVLAIRRISVEHYTRLLEEVRAGGGR